MLQNAGKCWKTLKMMENAEKIVRIFENAEDLSKSTDSWKMLRISENAEKKMKIKQNKK